MIKHHPEKRLLTILVYLIMLSSSAGAQDAGLPTKMSGIPGSFQWINQPVSATTDSHIEKLYITSRASTDYFIDPREEHIVKNAPMALFAPADTFLFSAHIQAPLKSVFDAGALVVYDNDNMWV